MPGNNNYPIPALLSTFDARQWSGLNVYDRGATSISLSTFGTDEGVYEDVLSFLNGRGSNAGADLQSDLTATATGVATWEITLLSSDRIRIRNDGDAFTIADNAAATALGFPGGAASVLSGGWHTCTATADWTRGNWNGLQLVITPASSAAFNLPSFLTRAQDVITMLRVTGTTGDADDLHDPAGTFDSLEARELVAVGAGSLRWGLTAEGHVFAAWPSGLGVLEPTWVSTSFRNRLGFSGREVAISAGGLDWVIADFPCPGVYVPTRPLARPLELQTDEVSDAMRLTDGSWAGFHGGTFYRWLATIHVDGPQDTRSTWLHWARKVLPYLPQGAPCTLYLEWGDPRRRLEPQDIVSGTDAYSLLHTSELEGARGRIRGTMLGDLQRTLTRSGRTARRFPVSFIVEERP